MRITLKNKMTLRIGALLLMLTIILTGCSRLSKNCPIDFPNSKWVCEDPHIELVVDGQQRYRTTLIEDGKEKQFFLGFRFGDGIEASEFGDEPFSMGKTLFRGSAKYKQDSFTIKIREDNLWNGAYSKLIFTRVE